MLFLMTNVPKPSNLKEIVIILFLAISLSRWIFFHWDSIKAFLEKVKNLKSFDSYHDLHFVNSKPKNSYHGVVVFCTLLLLDLKTEIRKKRLIISKNVKEN